MASYPPVLESAGRLYSQLAESLVRMGHEVTVVTEHPAEHLPLERNHPYFEDSSSEAMLAGVRVRRVSTLQFLGSIPGGKAVRFGLSCLLFSLRGMLLRRQEAILVYSPPLFMGFAGFLLSLRHGCGMVLNVQDLHPKVLFDLGAVRSKAFGWVLQKLEAFNYRKAKALVVYSKGNRAHLARFPLGGEINVIPNWVDTAELPAPGAPNSFRNEEGLEERFLLSYVGLMKPPQGLDVLVEAATLLRSRSDIAFFLAGDGSSRRQLEEMVRERSLTNVLVRPAMPAERYRRCLQASDVCLMTLGAQTPPETVPGKLAYIMAAERPLIAAVNLAGDAAKVIGEANAGICVSPGDARALAEAVLTLRDNAALRSTMAKNAAGYAFRYFSREACTQQYEGVLRSVGEKHSQ